MSYRDEVMGRLQTAIRNSDMTYEAISRKAGLHANSVRGYMSKQRIMPSAMALGRLCKALGASADQILGLEDGNERT